MLAVEGRGRSGSPSAGTDLPLIRGRVDSAHDGVQGPGWGTTGPCVGAPSTEVGRGRETTRPVDGRDAGSRGPKGWASERRPRHHRGRRVGSPKERRRVATFSSGSPDPRRPSTLRRPSRGLRPRNVGPSPTRRVPSFHRDPTPPPESPSPRESSFTTPVDGLSGR